MTKPDFIPPLSASRRAIPPVPPVALASGSGTVHPWHCDQAAVRRGAPAAPPTVGGGEDQEVSWSLPPSPSSVPKARRLVREQLSVWALDGCCENAELLVSELVTNALRHGDGQARLGVATRDGSVRIEVEDGGAAAPRVRRPQASDEGGRGLHLISELSSRWGTAPTENGKVVWFELALTGFPGATGTDG